MWLMQLQLDLSQNKNNLSLVTAFFLLRSLRIDTIARNNTSSCYE